jgi:hypothetical protein
MPRSSPAAAKVLTTAAVTIALAGIAPLAPVVIGVAWATPGHMPRPTLVAATSRLSGLPFGGAGDYNGPPPIAQHRKAKPTANADPRVRAQATSRLSGLPFGGASDYNGPLP